MQIINLKDQYLAYKTEIDEAIRTTLDNTGFILGPTVAALESELSEFVGAKHCITCASGTDALVIALMAAGIGPGDEVIVPGFTFFATAEAVTLVGSAPVFVDIDPVTFNMDPSRISTAISGRTRAIIPVGLFGQVADMDEIMSIASRSGLMVIEDAAQSFCARYGELKSGNLGHMSCTSFYPAKPLGAFGDGGAVFTNDDSLAATCRELMNHGQVAGYVHKRIGLNARLDALQAAVLRVKLSHFADEIELRRQCADRYNQGLSGLPGLVLPRVKRGRTSTYAQYTVRNPERDALREYLSGNDIPTAVHYPRPVYAQEAYASLGMGAIQAYRTECPETERACREALSLPFGPFLSDVDQARVVQALAVFSQGEKP